MMKKLFYKRDAVILLVVLLVIAAGFAAMWIYRSGRSDAVAVVEHNSVQTHRINLDKTLQSDIIFIDDDDGCHVEIEVENGRIRVRSSSCPDKVCVSCGWLGKKGDTAVCLPNGVVVRVE